MIAKLFFKRFKDDFEGAAFVVMQKVFDVFQQKRLRLVVPDDARIQRNVMIPQGERNGAKSGQLVVAEITQAQDARRPPIGRIVAVLGDKLTPSLVVETAIHGHHIPHEFPQAVLDEAAAVPLEVPASAIKGRVDLRQLPLVTIDGEDAKDFDDAVYCEKQGKGYRLLVAIADVSHYDTPGSALDADGLARGNSVYFPRRVIPMRRKLPCAAIWSNWRTRSGSSATVV